MQMGGRDMGDDFYEVQSWERGLACLDIPDGAKFSPSRKQWKLPNGKVIDAGRATPFPRLNPMRGNNGSR